MGLAGVSPNQVPAGGGDQTRGAVHNIWARGRSSQSWKHFYNGYISREREESIYNTSIEDHWGCITLHRVGLRGLLWPCDTCAGCHARAPSIPGVWHNCDHITQHSPMTGPRTWREKSPPPPGYWARSWQLVSAVITSLMCLQSSLQGAAWCQTSVRWLRWC